MRMGRAINPGLPRVFRAASVTTFPQPAEVVAYWPLEETSGLHYDATGHGHNLTRYGSPGYADDGKIARCLNSDGDVADYLNTTDVTDFIHAGSFSVQAWAKWAFIDTARSIAALWTASGVLRGWNMRIHTDSKIAFGVTSDGSTIIWAIADAVANADQWYHVVGICDTDNNKVLVYVNSVLQAIQPAFAGTLAPNATPLQIAAIPGASSARGRIDEVCVWDCALTLAEVQTLYNAGNGLPYPS